ncbi:hypothetical protein Dimus_035909, partial [Dionaea muscipula]
VEGNAGREKSFMIARMKLEALENCMMRFSEATPSSARRKDEDIARVDPSGPSAKKLNLRSSEREFERKRASRFHDDLEKAKRENAGLLALLHRAQTNPILSFHRNNLFLY